ncbi:MAG: anthranilate phosphoribosyltransferase [marine benthic group bacterium]|nr:anthranilate phosphoribosyltransferase [Gemmatimonadota bacterium]
MNGELRVLLERLLEGCDLCEDEARTLLIGLTDEAFPHPMAGAFLAALRLKGETAEEVRGFASAMRELSLRPELPASAARAVDVVGTGGDGSGSINLSTGAALLTAACGQPVVKHGNGSISSRCGSADVLRALGLPMPLDEPEAANCLSETGFTFLFAPHYHPAMRALAPVRRALGVRTVFNLLGPLTNPAAPPYLVAGAWNEQAARLMAETLTGMPVERAFVVHGAPGWDEATPVGPFVLFDVHDGRVDREVRDPARYGIPRCAPDDLVGGDAGENAARLREALSGTAGPDRDALSIGAALAIEVSGAAPDYGSALAKVEEALTNGTAVRILDALASRFPQPAGEAKHA